MIHVSVQRGPIDLAAEIARVERVGAGGIATFSGHVRADADEAGGVTTLELEHYPGATEATLVRLAATAAERWSLIAASVVHRVGPMAPGSRIVLVATAAAHRAAALEACAYLIDRLKTDAPFWKRETRGGVARWVEARGGDDAAAARWSEEATPAFDPQGERSGVTFLPPAGSIERGATMPLSSTSTPSVAIVRCET